MRKQQSRFCRNGRRGMAMASVLFAMAIFMLLGTLITTNALRTRNTVTIAESNFKVRNRLEQIGEFFVAEVKAAATNESYNELTDDETVEKMAESLTSNFTAYDYQYDVQKTDAESGETTYRLTIYTTTGDGDTAQRTDHMYVAVRKTTADGTTSYSLVEWKFV